MKLYDAHNHLADPGLEAAWPGIARRLGEIECAGAIVNGVEEGDWAAVAALAGKHPWARPSFGLHPWYVGNRSPEALARLRARLTAHPTALVGEIGLDRWMLDRARPDDWRLRGLRRAPLDEQQELLAAQLALAMELGRAVTIHCVSAWGPWLDVVRRQPLPRRWLLHAYGGPVELLAELTERGAYFSFNGRFLEPRHRERQEVFRHVAPERLLVETDAPAMAPAPGWAEFELPPDPEGHVLNHPANLRPAYRGLAELRGESLAALVARVEENFQRFNAPAAS